LVIEQYRTAYRIADYTLYRSIATKYLASSPAVAERPRCRVG